MKCKYFIFGFLIGVILCITTLIIIKPSTSIVHTTTHELKFENGIIIPKGIKLVEQWTLPEGVTTMALYVNILDEQVNELFDYEVRKGDRWTNRYGFGGGFE